MGTFGISVLSSCKSAFGAIRDYGLVRAVKSAFVAGGGYVGGNLIATEMKESDDFTRRTVISLLCIAVLTAQISIHRTLIMRALSRRAWVFNPTGVASRVQGFIMNLLGMGRTGTFDMQEALPSLPVPDREMMRLRILDSVRPFAEEQEYDEFEAELNTFMQGPQGELTHSLLELMAAGERNWLEELWSKLAYLRCREPLQFSSSWYGISSILPRRVESEHPQLTRAAIMMHTAALYDYRLRTDTLPRDGITGGTEVPVCMDQCTRLFRATRIPQKEEDRLVTAQDSKYIAIYYRGEYHKVPVIHTNGIPYTLEQCYGILLDLNRTTPGESTEINVMTAQDRDTWAEDRVTLRDYSEVNRHSLQALEDAMLVIVLDEVTITDPTQAARNAQFNLYGTWVDKLTMRISKDGTQISALVEHTVSDATIQAAMLQQALRWEETRHPVEAGCLVIKEVKRADPFTFGFNERLTWKLPPGFSDKCAQVKASFQERASGVQMDVLRFEEYGKELIKFLRVGSPDSWFQMAMQLAYYRMFGKIQGLTYESASTRLFFHGRTETIRCGSEHSQAFVEAMGTGDVLGTKRALEQALGHHERIRKEATTGRGVDRYLLGLKIVGYLASHPPTEEERQRLGLGERLWRRCLESLGEKPAILNHRLLNLPYTLATSQTPFRNGAGNSCGGGFLPVLDNDGNKIPNSLGVSYALKQHVFFSHHTGDGAAEYSRQLSQALKDMRDLYTSELGEAPREAYPPEDAAEHPEKLY